MAEATRSTVPKAATPPVGGAGAAKPLSAVTLSLPKPSDPVPQATLNDVSIVIHGEKKIGKTTLAMAEPGSFLLTFDPEQKFLGSPLQRYCKDWNTFIGYVTLLEAAQKAGTFPYKRVVIDGVDIWYRECQIWCEKKLAVDHISEEGWGKGFDLLKQSFAGAVKRTMALSCGTWYICHSAWKEVESRRRGQKIVKLLPIMKGGAEEILIGLVEGWFAYDYWEAKRILVVRGDERTGAGNRMRGHFMTPKGRPIHEVPMGSSPEEAWKNLMLAFNNKQYFTTMAELEKREEDEALRVERAMPKMMLDTKKKR